jgi:hypothetical protein
VCDGVKQVSVKQVSVKQVSERGKSQTVCPMDILQYYGYCISIIEAGKEANQTAEVCGSSSPRWTIDVASVSSPRFQFAGFLPCLGWITACLLVSIE